MAQVGIVMGSDSDMPIMAKAAEILDELGISYEMRIISAHREPDVFFEYAKTAEERGLKGIIAGAGWAAIPDARDWHSDAHDIAWRPRFTVFHCADAIRHSSGDRGNQRRCKRGTFGGKDSCGIR